jgi:hypothetical protein
VVLLFAFSILPPTKILSQGRHLQICVPPQPVPCGRGIPQEKESLRDWSALRYTINLFSPPLYTSVKNIGYVCSCTVSDTGSDACGADIRQAQCLLSAPKQESTTSSGSFSAAIGSDHGNVLSFRGGSLSTAHVTIC